MKIIPTHIGRRNWLWETRSQEIDRRLRAVEQSVRSAHDRINEVDDRKADRGTDNHPSL